MSTHPVSVHPVVGCAQVLENTLAGVADTPVWAMSASDKTTVLQALGRVEAQVAELRLRVLAAAGDVAEQSAARNPGTWLAHATHLDPRHGHSEWILARKLDQHYPRTAAAMRQGGVNLSQARVIVQALDALPQDLDRLARVRAEKHLVELAARFEPRELRVLGKKILEVAAPEIAEEIEAKALEREEQRAKEKCSLRFRSQGDGTTRITGILPDPIAARLTTYLDALTSPRNTPTDGTGRPGRDAGQDAGPFGWPAQDAGPFARPGVTNQPEAGEPMDPTGWVVPGTSASTHTSTAAGATGDAGHTGTAGTPGWAAPRTHAANTTGDTGPTGHTGTGTADTPEWAAPGTHAAGTPGDSEGPSDPDGGDGGGGAAGTGLPDYGPRHHRLGQALCLLLEHLDPSRLPDHGGDATVVTVTIDHQTLINELGTATIEASTTGEMTISAAEARRLACTAKILPAVLGANSEILDLGRTRRLYNPAQRRALCLRDKHCRAEGCSIPARWCEAHHLKPWSQGGATDLDDGVLFCTHHHHRAHDTRYTTEKLPTGDYRFHRRT